MSYFLAFVFIPLLSDFNPVTTDPVKAVHFAILV